MATRNSDMNLASRKQISGGFLLLAGVIGSLAFFGRNKPQFNRQYPDGSQFAYVDGNGSTLSTYRIRSARWFSSENDWTYSLDITSGPEDGGEIILSQSSLISALTVPFGERLIQLS